MTNIALLADAPAKGGRAVPASPSAFMNPMWGWSEGAQSQVGDGMRTWWHRCESDARSGLRCPHLAIARRHGAGNRATRSRGAPRV